MDNLNNLPLKPDTSQSPQEKEIMGKFFSSGKKQKPKKDPRPVAVDPPESEGLDWKNIGYTTLIFFALANPWIDMILCKIPYCGENALMLFGMKTLAFALIYIILLVYSQ